MSVFLFFSSSSFCCFVHFCLFIPPLCATLSSLLSCQSSFRLSVFFLPPHTVHFSGLSQCSSCLFFICQAPGQATHTPTCTTPPVSRDPFVTRASVSIPILLSGVRRSWPSLLLHIALRAELHNGSTLARLHTRLHVHTHTKTSTDMHSCAGALKVATTTGRCTCTHWSKAVLVNEK